MISIVLDLHNMSAFTCWGDFQKLCAIMIVNDVARNTSALGVSTLSCQSACKGRKHLLDPYEVYASYNGSHSEEEKQFFQHLLDTISKVSWKDGMVIKEYFKGSTGYKQVHQEECLGICNDTCKKKKKT